MTVRIDEQRCVGCGLCEENHPDLFTVGEKHATVSADIIPEDLRESVMNTAAECPADAIVIEVTAL